jgi:hypothetical protein
MNGGSEKKYVVRGRAACLWRCGKNLSWVRFLTYKFKAAGGGGKKLVVGGGLS